MNVNQKRYAVASALAATAVPALVMARGHRVEEVPELPLVVDSSLQTCTKTAAALATLTALGAAAEVEKVRRWSLPSVSLSQSFWGRRKVESRGLAAAEADCTGHSSFVVSDAAKTLSRLSRSLDARRRLCYTSPEPRLQCPTIQSLSPCKFVACAMPCWLLSLFQLLVTVIVGFRGFVRSRGPHRQQYCNTSAHVHASRPCR